MANCRLLYRRKFATIHERQCLDIATQSDQKSRASFRRSLPDKLLACADGPIKHQSQQCYLFNL